MWGARNGCPPPTQPGHRELHRDSHTHTHIHTHTHTHTHIHTHTHTHTHIHGQSASLVQTERMFCYKSSVEDNCVYKVGPRVQALYDRVDTGSPSVIAHLLSELHSVVWNQISSPVSSATWLSESPELRCPCPPSPSSAAAPPCLVWTAQS